MLVLIDTMHFDKMPESRKLECGMERALKKLRVESGIVEDIVSEGGWGEERGESEVDEHDVGDVWIEEKDRDGRGEVN